MKTATPNLEERTVDFNGREIKVSNWWNWKLQGSADLYLDGEHLDQNKDKIATGKKYYFRNMMSLKTLNRLKYMYHSFLNLNLRFL